MNIILTAIQQKILKKYAQANNKTEEEYATNIISSWLEEHIKSAFADKLKNKTNEELEQLLGGI